MPDVYREHCVLCHGAAEQDSLYPSLLEVARQRSAAQMATAIINGKFDRGGEQGGQVIPVMPAHDRLSDATIAELVNALLDAVGSVQTRIDPERVAGLRDRP